ncbi:hypothetical protein C0J52_05844 [Blattella germanica]|nr:hypothetical protein C0J52_05844 [Blattella germanica]
MYVKRFYPNMDEPNLMSNSGNYYNKTLEMPSHVQNNFLRGDHFIDSTRNVATSTDYVREMQYGEVSEAIGMVLGFDDMSPYRLHKLKNSKKNSPKYPIDCTICKESFSRKLELDVHLMSHNEELYKCPICQKSFPDVHLMQRHIGFHTGSELHQCPVCMKCFTRKSLLNRHMSMHTTERPHHCIVCKKSFKKKGDLHIHVKNCHSSTMRHECSVCQKTFSRRDTMLLHMRLHSNDKLFQCPVCLKCFPQKFHLNRHVTVHSQERPYPCYVCSKSFKSISELNIHTEIHYSDKRHKCPVCEKVFSRQDSMRLHMKLHTGDNLYECPVCLKSFTQKFHLNRHSLVHSDEKPHQCPTCNKMFKCQRNLEIHCKTHVKEKQHECVMCHKTFARRDTMLVHMRLHTREKLHKCSICFNIKQHLQSHEKHHHKDKGPSSAREKSSLLISDNTPISLATQTVLPHTGKPEFTYSDKTPLLYPDKYVERLALTYAEKSCGIPYIEKFSNPFLDKTGPCDLGKQKTMIDKTSMTVSEHPTIPFMEKPGSHNIENLVLPPLPKPIPDIPSTGI